jgi:HEAT repeat protein
MQQTLAGLLNQISNGVTWNEKLLASDNVAKIYGKSAVPSLILLIESRDVKVRDAAALALREIGDSTAVDPLFEAVKNPLNSQARSTLVYALEALDCREHFLDVVALVLADKADVRIAAMTILQEQGFLVDDADVKLALANVRTSQLESDWIELIAERLNSFT